MSCSRSFNAPRTLKGQKPGQGYTHLLFHGLYTEDGRLLRGTGGKSKTGSIPARRVATPYCAC